MSIAITLTDEEIESRDEGLMLISQMINDARHTIDNHHSHTAEEVAMEYARFVDLFEVISGIGAMLLDSSIEIARMTDTPETK